MARPGRKRKKGRRQPNGQPHRSAKAIRDEAVSVVLEARARVYGVSKEVAEKMGDTSWLGKYEAQGHISRRQYNAGTALQELRREKNRLFPPNQDTPEAGVLDRVRGRTARFEASEEEEARQFAKIVERWDACVTAIRREMADWVIEKCVFEDMEVARMLPMLRAGLDAVADTLSIGD